MRVALSKTKLAYFRKFHRKKEREAEGRFLVEGWHLLEEALKAGKSIRALIIEEGAARSDAEEDLLERASAVSDEIHLASREQGSQISDTKAGQGVYALLESVSFGWEPARLRLDGPGPLRIVALDAVSDPGNCGAILRACDWFGIDAALLGAGCSELENGKTARASMGALFRLPTAVSVDLGSVLPQLKERGIAILAAELDGATSLERYVFPERAVLVIGNEARGVSPWVSAAADERLCIPRFGGAESLNAAAAAAVFLSRWRMP